VRQYLKDLFMIVVVAIIACAALVLFASYVAPARAETARYPIFRSPVMDCLNSGRSNEQCKSADKRSARQIYHDMMGDMGYSPRAADKLYGKGKPTGTRTLKCRPDRSGGFDCEQN
jgi:hypothetical protein